MDIIKFLTNKNTKLASYCQVIAVKYMEPRPILMI